jgi:uncharacterized membrane protein YraQ (UPF0718 family)
MKPSWLFWPASSTSLSRRVCFFICCAVMFICVVAQGLYLYARDGVTPDPLPSGFIHSDWAWMLLALSFFIYFRKPVITMAIAWLVFAVFAVSLERFSEEHTAVWFLYRHSLLLGFILASHVGFFLARSSRGHLLGKQQAGEVTPSASTPPTV